MLFFNKTDKLKNDLKKASENTLDKRGFILKEIQGFRNSKYYKNMKKADDYYMGEHDILSRKRTAIGAGGDLQEVKNLPNNRVVDNQYRKMVDQKTNYLVGKPLTIQCDNKDYLSMVNDRLGMKFYRLLKTIGKEAINDGVSYVYVYYNEEGKLSFKKFKAKNCIPIWADEDETILNSLIRVVEQDIYIGSKEKRIERIEYYTKEGVERYVISENVIVDDLDEPTTDYIDFDGSKYNFERLPVIPFRYNSERYPLIKRVKCLQDALNFMYSDFLNGMQEDARNTVLVIKNFDGEDLGQFRNNLMTYGAVKVRSDRDGNGGIDTLSIAVNSGNYQIIIQLLKKAIIENAMGYDAKDDRLTGNANQMNIQSMYSDIDLDANGMEMEFQASLEELMWFVKNDIELNGMKPEDISFVFNRDIPMNVGEKINQCTSSAGIISHETILANHPFVTNVEDELERIALEQEKASKEASEYQNAFRSKEQEETEDIEDEE